MSLDSLVFETYLAADGLREVRLRPSTPGDAQFVDTLTRMVMEEYVAATWPDPGDRDAYFKKNLFVCPTTKIIQIEGKDIGRLTVTTSESTVTIDNIHLLPEYHGFGIGKMLIEFIIDDARSTAKAVELQVLIINPAKKLYERLGFDVYKRDSERLYMRLKTPSPEVST